ncbi:hypothetical protein A2U01_0024399, partial [Trifolium medium]|nr:hypothetical protein [Trifolium medium]
MLTALGMSEIPGVVVQVDPVPAGR